MKSLTDVNENDSFNTGGASKVADANGFDALLVGYANNNPTSYNYGLSAYFWSSSSVTANTVWYRVLSHNELGMERNSSLANNKSLYFSVRCKKDN
jgi:uncharacterized protein (TIGR02145 family)